MPISWTIWHEKRRVIATAEGIVALKDVEQYLDAIVVEGAMPYAKIFDASAMQPQGTDHDVLMLGARMRAYVATLEGGPLAFVVTTQASRDFIDRYVNLTSGATRPLKICYTADEARHWLDEQT